MIFSLINWFLHNLVLFFFIKTNVFFSCLVAIHCNTSLAYISTVLIYDRYFSSQHGYCLMIISFDCWSQKGHLHFTYSIVIISSCISGLQFIPFYITINLTIGLWKIEICWLWRIWWPYTSFRHENTGTLRNSTNIFGHLKTATLTTLFHDVSFHLAHPTTARVKDVISVLERNS